MNPSPTSDIPGIPLFKINEMGNKPFINCTRQLPAEEAIIWKDSSAGNTCLLRWRFLLMLGKHNLPPRPPPGFPATKLDTTKAPVPQSTSTFVNIHTGPSEVERLRNNSLHRVDSANEAENSSGNLGPSGVDGINNPYFLAQRMALERQRSLPNPYPCWPGIDTTSFPPKSVPDASPYSKLMPSLSDNSRQFHSPNFELISVIQGLSDMVIASNTTKAL
ncbi:hypothetical protein KIW84_033656 [Lathyrus oleraceus]|uniref:Uncharacterized protein n=1 Tax=Pisum sativum TaxID=3888 RepID=A0A9D4Y0P4_PEA|nr:hypothetical protein KIW84_033656 [Pisum sativum]